MSITFQHRLSLTAAFAALAGFVACSSSDDGNEAGAGGQGGGGGSTSEADAGATGGMSTGDSGAGGAAPAQCVPDKSGPVASRANTDVWNRVELEGATCSDGSVYPIFVNYSATSNNLMIAFEPGGACWDYASCSPDGGLRGAANPEGIADGIQHMSARYGQMPLHRKNLEDNPLKDWNMVFVPYCTGDLHTGNNVMTYDGPNGEQLTFRHSGHDNVQRAIEWISQQFDDVPQLLVTGCSAGGAASLLNYHFIRQGLGDAVQCSYMLDDSGPIFPRAGFSGPIHDKVRESWNVDPILDSLDGQIAGVTVEDLKADFGLINTALADQYPQDRLSLTLYRRDLNYSLYSYESFYDFPAYTRIHEMWDADIALIRELFDSRDNLGYYMPFYRINNCSHCVTIPPIGPDGQVTNDIIPTVLNEPWQNSDLTAESGSHWTLQDYVTHLLDDTQPLESLFEDDVPGEGFTDAEAAACQNL